MQTIAQPIDRPKSNPVVEAQCSKLIENFTPIDDSFLSKTVHTKAGCFQSIDWCEAKVTHLTSKVAVLDPSQQTILAPSLTLHEQRALLDGEVLISTEAYSAWGGAVTAKMYLPEARSQVWQQVTNYPRWVEFFPDLTHSEVLHSAQQKGGKRIYQVASKSFMIVAAQVEIYLRVFEREHSTGQQIQFCFERGSFKDFSADLQLKDCANGTLLTYSVRATPTLLVPSMLIQEAMRHDLPANMQQMRQVICRAA